MFRICLSVCLSLYVCLSRVQLPSGSARRSNLRTAVRVQLCCEIFSPELLFVSRRSSSVEKVREIRLFIQVNVQRRFVGDVFVSDEYSEDDDDNDTQLR